MRVRSWHFLVSGALGGLVGFAWMELLQSAPAEASNRLELIWSMAIYFAGFGLAVGAALGVTEGLVRRDGFRIAYGALFGLLLGGAGGLVGGALGQAIYGLVPARTQVESASDLALVLDSSGSMRSAFFGGNDPWGKRKKAAKALIHRLTPMDRVAIVDFDDTATVWLPLTQLRDDDARELARKAIAKIDDQGGTNLSAGLDAGLAELGAHRDPGRSQFLIFLTDGEGEYDPSSLALAQSLGVAVYTIGLGSTVQADLLQAIATGTGGKYFPVAKAGDLTALFGRILTEHRAVAGGTGARGPAAAPSDPSSTLVYVLRIVGWAIIGLVIGIGQGIRENTREDLLACSLGGLIGGLIGGALFDPIASAAAGGTGAISRAVADIVVGAAIGGSMRLIQQKVVDDSGRDPTPLSSVLPTNTRLLRLAGSSTAAPGGGRPSGSPAPAQPRIRPPEPVRSAPAPASPKTEGSHPPAIASAAETPSPALASRPSLAEFAERYPDRDEAMARARRDGGYSLSEIAKHFGVPASSVRRVVDR